MFSFIRKVIEFHKHPDRRPYWQWPIGLLGFVAQRVAWWADDVLNKYD